MDKNLTKATVLLSALALGGLSAADVQAMGGGTCISANLTISILRSPLIFGTITPCTATPGEVSISPNGNRSTTGCIAGTSGTVQSVEIRVGGTGGKAVISVTAPSYTVAAGGNTMIVDSYDFKIKGGGATLTANLPQNTVIGAVLNVAGGQAGGTYTGSFNVRATCL